ncbi:MAG: deoxyguanosinetriphosphate triphosphohydrolase [Dehalococcoidia bacterium]|nr:deoxyguanosinetriphosphate triphosphohydrolase [Dehalococcoidia bacterium]
MRERLLAHEEALSPRAARSAAATRRSPEGPPGFRTEFQRDRDRIIHSKAFRRLKHKTQVFIAPTGDHFVTRLTHTLEVQQIARTVARALDLNEDLAEAIALAHDIGHTPFGHAGEQALAEIMPGGFRHNEQSVRVVELLENEGAGLNLTDQVREGVLKHSKVREGIEHEAWGIAGTLEGQIVKIADSVAYLNHDIADAIRAGLISDAGLPPQPADVIGRTHSERINTMVSDIVEASWEGVTAPREQTADALVITMSPPVLAAANELREFMFERVYLWEGQASQARRAGQVVAFLYEHFAAHPGEIASDYQIRDDPPSRRAADFVSGMTDHYAMELATGLGFPESALPAQFAR